MFDLVAGVDGKLMSWLLSPTSCTTVVQTVEKTLSAVMSYTPSDAVSTPLFRLFPFID